MTSVLHRHEGIQFATSGRVRLGWDVRDNKTLVAKLCGALGGELGKLSKRTRYLILGRSSGTRAAEKLNSSGAQIEFIPQDELHKLFALTTTELIELIQAGDSGRAAINTIRRALDLVLPSLEKVDLANADLRGLNLGHVSLAETNLRGANLTSIRIDGRGYHGCGMAVCHRACFDNAVMVDADLSFVELDGASFREVDLRNASFENATLVEANFTRANLTGTVLKADLSRAKLNEAVLRGVRIDGCLEGTGLAGFDLSETEIEGSLRGLDLRGSTLRVEGAIDLHGADLRGARFVDSCLDAADLRDAKIEGVDFGETSLVCARFGPPKGTGCAGPAFSRLQQLWQGKTAGTEMTIELGADREVELRLMSRYSGPITGHWSLTGPDTKISNYEDPEEMGRWFGGENGVPRLDLTRFWKERTEPQGLRTSELEQLLRDVWSELLGIASINAAQVEARRDAEASIFLASREELSAKGEEAILNALDADPDNEQMWLVYADWLQDHGDPRGEIIVQEPQLDEQGRWKLQERLSSVEVIGDLAHAEFCRFEFRHAFIHKIRLLAGRQAAKTCRQLIDHPATRFARCLDSNTAAAAVIKPMFDLLGARPIVDLSIGASGFTDATPLREHVKLRALHLGYTRIDSAAPLAPLVNVERLSLYLTRVTSLDALAAMMALRSLDLGRAHNAESLAPIAGKSKLEELTIWSSPVKDLDVLLTLDSLAKLWVHPRQLSSELHGALVEKNPELEIVEWSYLE